MTLICRMARLARSVVLPIALTTGVALGSAAVASAEPPDCDGVDIEQCPAAEQAEREPTTTTLQPPLGDPFFPNLPIDPPISVG